MVRKLFSFPVAMCSLLAALAVVTVRDHFDNNDLWWHLKIGQLIWTTHSIPTEDVFSYTAFHHPLVPQEWLSEVSIYCAYALGGLRGLMVWFCIAASLLLILGYVLSWFYSKNAKVAFAGALVVCMFSAVGFAIRPQMISFVLLIAELLLIHAGRTRSAKWFWGLPIVFVLWINCHASFILGIVVAGVYLGSSFFDFRWRWLVAGRWEPVRQRMLALSLMVSIVALFVNPTGFRQIFYPFDFLFNMPSLLKSIQEFAPLSIADEPAIALIAVLVACLLAAVTGKAPLLIEELILLGLGAYLSFSHMRMLPIFGIFAGPIVARLISGFWDNYDPAKDRVLPNAGVMGASLFAIILFFPTQQNLEAQVRSGSPVKAVEFMKQNHLSGPVLNDHAYGGYLMWEAPEYPVFIDSRTDVYVWNGIFDQYLKWSNRQTDPSRLPDKYGVNLCLVAADSNRDHILSSLKNWQRVYADEQAVVYVRRPAVGHQAP
ncbi:MAG: hypothetical protein ACRD3S_14625 [Terracidiphilus sp.]